MNFRIGHGYDVHALGEGLRLVLGGVEIAHTKGCIAHSDGDVLVHAICDALLGAAALGDIGKHFPEISDKLLNLLQLKELSYTMADSDLLETAIMQKTSALSPIPFAKAIDLKQNKKYLKYAAIPLLVLLLLLVQKRASYGVSISDFTNRSSAMPTRI